MATFTERIIGAAKLDVDTYEEVEADTEAMGQALILVVASSLAAGVGTFRDLGVTGVVFVSVSSVIGWFIWAGLTYVIGTKILPEPQTDSNIGELLRTIGFSSSPGLLRVFGFLPVAGAFINLAVGVWMLFTMVVAVRQALDYQSTGRAIGVCLVGWLFYLAVGIFAGLLLAGFGIAAAATR